MEDIKEEPNKVPDALREIHIKFCMLMSQLGGTSSKRFCKLRAQLSKNSSDSIEDCKAIYKNLEKVLLNISSLTRDLVSELGKYQEHFKIPEDHADTLNILVQISNRDQMKGLFPSSSTIGIQTEETAQYISKSVQTEDLSKTADELPRNLNEMDDSDSDATEDLEVTNNKKEYTLKEKNYLDVDGGTKNATEDGSDDDNTQSIVFSLGQDVHNSVADDGEQQIVVKDEPVYAFSDEDTVPLFGNNTNKENGPTEFNLAAMGILSQDSERTVVFELPKINCTKPQTGVSTNLNIQHEQTEIDIGINENPNMNKDANDLIANDLLEREKELCKTVENICDSERRDVKLANNVGNNNITVASKLPVNKVNKSSEREIEQPKHEPSQQISQSTDILDSIADDRVTTTNDILEQPKRELSLHSSQSTDILDPVTTDQVTTAADEQPKDELSQQSTDIQDLVADVHVTTADVILEEPKRELSQQSSQSTNIVDPITDDGVTTANVILEQPKHELSQQSSQSTDIIDPVIDDQVTTSNNEELKLELSQKSEQTTDILDPVPDVQVTAGGNEEPKTELSEDSDQSTVIFDPVTDGGVTTAGNDEEQIPVPQQSEQEVSPPAEQSISKSNQYNRSGDERILADDSDEELLPPAEHTVSENEHDASTDDIIPATNPQSPEINENINDAVTEDDSTINGEKHVRKEWDDFYELLQDDFSELEISSSHSNSEESEPEPVPVVKKIRHEKIGHVVNKKLYGDNSDPNNLFGSCRYSVDEAEQESATLCNGDTETCPNHGKEKVLFPECFIRLNRLSNDCIEKYNKKSVSVRVTDDEDEDLTENSDSVDDEHREDREIERLTNLRTLDKRKRQSSSSSLELSQKTRKSKRKKKKLNSDDPFDLSDHSDDASDSDTDHATNSASSNSASPVLDCNIEPNLDLDILKSLNDLSDESNTSSKESDVSESDKEEEKQKKLTKTVQKTTEKTPDTTKKSNPESKWRNDPLLRDKFSSDSDSSGSCIIRKRVKRRKLFKEPGEEPNKSDDEKANKETAVKKEENIGSDGVPESVRDTQNIYETCTVIPDSFDSESDIEFVSSSPYKLKNTIYLDDSDPEIVGEDESSPKKGRRNIRAVLDDVNLEEATKKANKEEEERRERISQKNAALDNLLSQSSIEDEGIVLDFDEESKETVVVHPRLSARLKPHQQKGVRFMWDACYESIKRLQESEGSGCILAHCMGLGKTFQVVALIHTLFTHKVTKTNHVLVVCPLSTVTNWSNEFNIGLRMVEHNINVFPLSDRSSNKSKIIDKWRQKTGVLIMGYEAYEKLTRPDNNEKKILSALVDPGPDLIICDEGHLVKNCKAVRSKALMQVKTRRRIVLTGTPMQNNLKEYYSMVQFVKPNLLGTFYEFSNRFVNPITNGQYDDSTEADIIIMKKRSHVLHKILKGIVQRYEVTELKKYLPEKLDYVVFIKLHPIQINLYKKYIDFLAHQQGKLFLHYRALQCICTHPYVLHLSDKSKTSKKKMTEMDVIVLDPEIKDNEPLPLGWWREMCPDDYDKRIQYGPKFKVMMHIIDESEKVGDKVLVFSNSIPEMDAIEHFLQIAATTKNKSWKKNEDYYRLDGTVSPDLRTDMCNAFNAPDCKARVFLMSHRVGGLGLNLTSANRVILMDVNWNPSYESQSIFRTYRFGQTKICYVYRLVTMGTMEEVVYQRSVTKLAIAGRVVDEHQITRHYKSNELQEVLKLKVDYYDEPRPLLKPPIDEILAKLLLTLPNDIFRYHEHQSLLENLPDEELNEDEMKLAWEEFTKEREEKQNALLHQQAVQQALQRQMSQMGPGPSNLNINSMIPMQNTAANVQSLPSLPDPNLQSSNVPNMQSEKTATASSHQPQKFVIRTQDGFAEEVLVLNDILDSNPREIATNKQPETNGIKVPVIVKAKKVLLKKPLNKTIKENANKVTQPLQNKTYNTQNIPKLINIKDAKALVMNNAVNRTDVNGSSNLKDVAPFMPHIAYPLDVVENLQQNGVTITPTSKKNVVNSDVTTADPLSNDVPDCVIEID